MAADHLSGQILVRYVPQARQADAQLRGETPLSAPGQDSAWAELSHLLNTAAQGQVRILGHIPQLGVMLLQVPADAEPSTAAELARQPAVRYVEPNYRAYALETPNDAEWSKQWALTKINAPQAWDIVHSQAMVIAVVDTGTYLQHPDLINVLWTNAGEIPDNGCDDDGNGKVDDVHGWHFYQNCTTGSCGPDENRLVDDGNGHGTHVTGIAVAETNNAAGVAGVSWGARAMIVKVLDESGDGYYYDIAAGIVYAADNGAKVINLSLGGQSSSQLLQDAVNYAYGKGALVVAATGNSGGAVLYPAACQNVMAVAATDTNDQRASFSNQGPEVDIAAPGDSIISTWPLPYLYYYKRGTSMATPHVSAAAALLWSWRPDWSNGQIQERLQSQADDVNSDLYPGHDSYLGWGRLNLYRVLAGLPPGPTPTPTALPQATATTTLTATPTVSPQATASPTPSPSHTPTPLPEMTPTPTITATPAVTPEATSTATPTPSATRTPLYHYYASLFFQVWEDDPPSP